MSIFKNSTSCWDFGDTKEDPIHRIHSYPAKFPAFITTKALQYAERNGVNVKVVADVFCGCGTTAVEARKKGKDFWGCDINPIASLIAQVKNYQYRDEALTHYFEAIKEDFCRTKPSIEDRLQINERINYWFKKPNIENLIRLDQAIRRQTPSRSPYRKFFLCGLSNILKPTSMWLTKSIKAQRDPQKLPRGVMEAFEGQFALMRNANSCNHFPEPLPKIQIMTKNFLSLEKPKWPPDLIVTSPPYVTSYDYADIHQLSTLWLGHASDHRMLRKNMIGNQYGVEPPETSAIAALGSAAEQTYEALLKKDHRRAHSVARYFLDMDKAVAKCGYILNSGGMAVFIIGNTQYSNIKIDNAKHLANCMERANFYNIERISRKVSLKIMTPYRDEKGRFTKDSTQRKLYGEEFVVIGRK